MPNELKPYCDEKDAEIERLIKERDEARRDVAVAEQNHYDCKKELEEMSDDILDSVRAERDRYKAESKKYQSAMLEKGAEIERLTIELQAMRGAANSLKMRIETARAEAITEFAENLKSHMIGSNKERIEVMQKFIDHWVEKMKGDQRE